MIIVIGIPYSTNLILEMKELYNMHKLCVVKVRANIHRQMEYAQAQLLIATSQKQKLHNIDASWLFSNYMQCK